MKQNDRRIGVSDILLFVFSVVELIGIRTFFAPCGPKEDGSWMSCHWAGQAVTGTAAVLVVLAICILAYLLREGYLVDIALIYTMLSFLAVVLLTKVYLGVYREHHQKKQPLFLHHQDPILEI